MSGRMHTSLIAGMVVAVATATPAFAVTKITNIEFLGLEEPNQIVVQADGPLVYDKLEGAEENQIILEFRDAKLANGSVGMKLDTSSFNSKVTLVSPYEVEGQDIVRLVVQLKESVPSQVDVQGNTLKLSVLSESTGGNSDKGMESASETVAGSAPVNPTAIDSRLKQFFEARETKRFIGKPITLQVRDAEVSDVFRLIGEASGFNIVLGSDVRGRITLSLAEVPWDLALDTVLHTLRLGAERNNNILRIVTLSNLAMEKQEQLRAKRAVEASAPRVTRVFPISYANLTDLQAILTKFGSASASLPGVEAGAEAGIIQVDNRTNSIIVRDTPENIDRIKKLIEILDTQTPQVVIEAKIIEATEAFSKTINGSLGFGSSTADAANSTQFIASFAGANPVDPLLASPGVFADGNAVGATTANSGTIGISPKLSFLPGLNRLNALLNLGESENQVKVISAPKTVAMNKEKANIVQGTPVLVPGTTFVAGVGSVPTTAVQMANLSLNVRPTVTNDSNILLDLAISRDIPFSLGQGNSAVANRNMTTIVVVENGATLVIGGIYTMTTNHSSSGFPFLRKIPILGYFFGSESNRTDRSELFIFITPRILNEKEAGLSA